MAKLCEKCPLFDDCKLTIIATECHEINSPANMEKEGDQGSDNSEKIYGTPSDALEGLCL